MDAEGMDVFEIHEPTYVWSIRVFRSLRRLLGINLALHQAEARLDEGDILVFNHFARFETFIPQFFVHEETGARCRSIAAAELVRGPDVLPTFLRRVGAVANDLPELLPLLAAEVMRGRKIVVFPEGGMVKDRRTVDARGNLASFSRSAGGRRSPHTGAAALALAVETFRVAVRDAVEHADSERLAALAASLDISVEQLCASAARRTRILPANITFYPIRVDDNLLSRGAALLARRGSLRINRRFAEELVVEGNLLLRDTDMDVRLAAPVDVGHALGWWEKAVQKRLARRVRSIEDVFALRPGASGVARRTLYRGVRRRVGLLRDVAMRGVYEAVSVNLSHVASVLIMTLLDRDEASCPLARFRAALYLAVKHCQRDATLALHRSLLEADYYAPLTESNPRGLDDFLDSVRACELVEQDGDLLRFLPKLREAHDIDVVRLENPVAVYANEAAPARGVRVAVERALGEAPTLPADARARLRFDDLVRAFDRDLARFSKPRHATINDAQTATADPRPYLLEAPQADTAVVLVHGFLSSPAELRGFGETLHARGVTVVGARLRGHGTSPWDLRSRDHAEWVVSVHAALEVAAGLAPRLLLVGFSLGGAVCTVAAARWPQLVHGLVSVCPPFRPRNRNMAFVPMVHGANRLLRAVTPVDGVLPFTANNSENPDVNYAHMPVHALNELRGFVDVLADEAPGVRCPALVVQAGDDPVVVASATRAGAASMPTARYVEVPADHHGILRRDTGQTQALVIDFVLGRDAASSAREGSDRDAVQRRPTRS